MIILSQDENVIVNFENVTKIKVNEYAGWANVFAYCDKDNCAELGVYKGNSRAKEVLKEIIDWVANTDGEDCKIFYMPKE